MSSGHALPTIWSARLTIVRGSMQPLLGPVVRPRARMGARDRSGRRAKRRSRRCHRGPSVGPADRRHGVDDRVGRIDGDAVREARASSVADDLDRARREVALHDEHLRTGVGELMAQELALVRGVDRDLDRAELQRREERDDLLGAVVEQRREAVTVPEAERRQRVSQPCDSSIARAVYWTLPPSGLAKSRYGPSGSDARRCASASSTVVCGVGYLPCG